MPLLSLRATPKVPRLCPPNLIGCSLATAWPHPKGRSRRTTERPVHSLRGRISRRPCRRASARPGPVRAAGGGRRPNAGEPPPATGSVLATTLRSAGSRGVAGGPFADPGAVPGGPMDSTASGFGKSGRSASLRTRWRLTPSRAATSAVPMSSGAFTTRCPWTTERQGVSLDTLFEAGRIAGQRRCRW